MTVSQLDGQVSTEAASAVLEAIRERRSVGKVRPDRPPREAIETILEAATCAPAHHLTDPWRFIVVSGDARAELGAVMARSKIDRMQRQGRDTDGELERLIAKALRAPVIIAVGVEPDQGPKVVEIEELESGAAALQNMLLAAHALGLAAMWRTGDAAYDPDVKTFLGLSPAAHIIGFVYVGYADASPIRGRHTPFEAVTTWLRWD